MIIQKNSAIKPFLRLCFIAAYSIPPGFGVLFLNQAATIERFLILVSFPAIALLSLAKLDVVATASISIALIAFISTVSLSSSQLIYLLFDFIFCVYPMLALLAFAKTRVGTFYLLNAILKISTFALILSVLINIAGIDLSFIQISDFAQWDKSRGVLNGSYYISFTGFYDQPSRLCSSIFFQYSLLLVCFYISTLEKSLVVVKRRISKYFNLISVLYLFLILLSQARYPFFIFLLYYLVALFRFRSVLRSNFLITFAIILLLSPFAVVAYSEILSYGVSNLSSLLSDLTSSQSIEEIRDVRVSTLLALYNDPSILIHVFLKPYGPFFWVSKTEVFNNTGIISSTWDDANTPLILYMSYGFLFVTSLIVSLKYLLKDCLGLAFIPAFYVASGLQGLSYSYSGFFVFLLTLCVIACRTSQAFSKEVECYRF